jgi:hypothetical protein
VLAFKLVKAEANNRLRLRLQKGTAMSHLYERCATQLLALTMLTTGALAGPIVTIDQQNAGPGNGSQGGVVFGQSFTPTLNRIDAFQIEIGDTAALVAVQILNGVQGFDGLAGPVLGTSNFVAVNTVGRQPIDFSFPGGIALVPGQEYVARVFATAGQVAPGIDGISIDTNNPYAGGQLLEAGFASSTTYLTTYDAIFAEGIITPEIPTLNGVVLGLFIALAFLALRVRAQAASERPLCADFSNDQY